MTDHPPLSVGMLLFENATQLDLTSAYEVFARMPGARVSLLANTLEPVRTEWGLKITPDLSWTTAPAFDVICVPGGWGVNALLSDDALLDFLAAQGETARYVTSVCTGALLLGAAGLLDGLRATTHWAYMDRLADYGADATSERVVEQGKVITSAGVSSGIDMALTLAAAIAGDDVAQAIQLRIEYDPAPPFDTGSTAKAPAHVIELARSPTLAPA